MVVESPAGLFIPSLGDRFGYVMHKRRPSEPYIVAFGGNIVEHCECMIEIVLVAPSFDYLNPFHRCKLWKDYLQEPGFQQEVPSDRRTCGLHDFHQLVNHALMRYDADSLRVAPDSFKGLGVNCEFELRCEPYGAHHAQRVVAECDVGVKRGAENPSLHIGQAPEEVYQLSETACVDTYGKGIDGKVPARQVFFKGSVLDHRLAGITVI